MGVFENRISSRKRDYDEDIYTRDSEYKGSDDREDSVIKFKERYTNSGYLKSTRSNKIEAIIKVTSGAVGKAAVGRLFDYVSREISDKDKKILLSEVEEKDIDIGGEKVYLETDTGEILQTKEQRSELLKEWSVDFVGGEYTKSQEWKLARLDLLKEERDLIRSEMDERRISNEKESRLEVIEKAIKEKKVTLHGKEYSLEVRSPKDTTHIILSVGGEHNPKKTERATEAVREFLSNNFAGAGYRYVFAAHTDTKNLHYHVIVKNVNDISRKRLRMDKADLFILRRDLSKELSRNGIERQATMRMDRVQTIERIHKGIEQIRERHSWYQSQLEKGKEAFHNFNISTYRNLALNKAQRLIRNSQWELGKFDIKGTNKELKQDLKYLREFKRELMKTTPDSFNIEKESLLKKINKDNVALFKKIETLESPNERLAQSKRSLTRRRHQKYLKEYVKKHEKDIVVAINYMKERKGIDKDQKKRNLEIIQALKLVRDKTISKGRDIGMSRERTLF